MRSLEKAFNSVIKKPTREYSKQELLEHRERQEKAHRAEQREQSIQKYGQVKTQKGKIFYESGWQEYRSDLYQRSKDQERMLTMLSAEKQRIINENKDHPRAKDAILGPRTYHELITPKIFAIAFAFNLSSVDMLKCTAYSDDALMYAQSAYDASTEDIPNRAQYFFTILDRYVKNNNEVIDWHCFQDICHILGSDVKERTKPVDMLPHEDPATQSFVKYKTSAAQTSSHPNLKKYSRPKRKVAPITGKAQGASNIYLDILGDMIYDYDGQVNEFGEI